MITLDCAVVGHWWALGYLMKCRRCPARKSAGYPYPVSLRVLSAYGSCTSWWGPSR